MVKAKLKCHNFFKFILKIHNNYINIVCVSEISDLEGVRVMETINIQCKNISQIH